jgi:hypothetical protein
MKTTTAESVGMQGGAQMVRLTEPLPPVRARLEQSELLRRGSVVTRFVGDRDLVQLREEASACRAHVGRLEIDDHDGQEDRGGTMDRRLGSALGGPRLRDLYYADEALALARRVTGVDWMPAGDGGMYFYYSEAGDYLGLHRDAQECDLVVITCVDEQVESPPGLAGALCLYPGRTGEPLSRIRATPDEGAEYVRLRPGESIVMLGGTVPHRLLPVGPGHLRIVAPLCYVPAA